MTNKKLKKYLKFSIILLIIILIVFLIRVIILNVNSKERVLKRLISGLDNLNYNYTSTDGKDRVQVSGKYEKVTNDKETIYNDYENKVSRNIYPEVTYMDERPNDGIEDMQYYQEYIKDYLDSNTYKYKYKGKKKLDGKKCTVIELIYPNEYYKQEIYYWINDETNIICKVEKYQYNIIKDKMDKVSDEKLNFDNASNKVEDIKISDEILSTHSTKTGGETE